MTIQMKTDAWSLLAAVTFSLTMLSAPVATAQVNPEKNWKQLSLESFDLIYDAQNQQLAEIYAQRLRALTPIYRDYWVNIPPKTVFVLNDRTDLTNGYATFLPYPLVMIFPVVPGPQDTIGEYHDWAWEISVHEYTHILEFSQRRGVVWGLSYLFGSIMTPNALMPRWSLEGAAVDHETRFSKGGRLRSKMQAGILRSLGKSGKLRTLRQAEINEFAIPTWPYGARPYLYGSVLWSDWIHSYGPAAVRDVHHNTGGRVPYLLDGAFEPVFEGRDMVEMFELTKTKMIEAADSEVAKLSVVPLTEGAKVDPEMRESLSPAVSPDGLKIAYIAKNAVLRRRVQVLVRPRADIPFDPSHRIQWFGKEFDQSLPTGSPLPRLDLGRGHGGDGDEHGGDGPPGGNITRISWHPSSNSFVFDQVLERNRFQESSDLWSFDIVKGKAERLTTEARAREPAWSPDGSKIAFTQIVPGRTDLAILDVDSKTIRRVYEAPPQGRVSFPVWISTSSLLFSVRHEGRENVYRIDLTTGATSPVLADQVDPQFLSVAKDRLLFTSTKNGVRNLYRADLDLKNVRPVTHAVSHVLASAFDESLKRYYYTELTDEAFQLKSIDEAEADRLPAELPVVGSYWGDRYANFELPFTPAPGAATTTGESASLPQAPKVDPSVADRTIPHVAAPTAPQVAAPASPQDANPGAAAPTSPATVTPAANLLTANSHDYSPWGYLWPRYWLPFVAWDDRGVYVSVQTSGSDPLAKHAYSVQAQYDSSIERGSYILGYRNQSFWPTLNFTSYDYSLQLAAAGQYSRAQLHQITASWELERYSPDWFVGVGANAAQREKFGLSSKRYSPILLTSYQNAFQNGEQISPESGWSGSLNLMAPHDPELNRTFAVAELAGSYYFSKWLPERHAIMIKAQGRSSDEPASFIEYMEQSVSYQTTNNTPFAQYLNRGYASGTFLGRNILGVNLEYRFPLGRLDAGPDGYPIYVHRWHGAIVADGTLIDGYVYDEKSNPMIYRRAEGTGFVSYGAELRMDVNVGYHIPVQFGLGLYVPANTRYTEAGPRLGSFLIL